jgi:uncharacterized protein (TIGR00369 family)
VVRTTAPSGGRPEDAAGAPPPGFALYQSSSPFSGDLGPFYQKVEPGGCRRLFRVRERHCNALGIVHGGMYMTFLDALMGFVVWRESGSQALTVRITCDFLAVARPGEWVEGVARLTRTTRALAFCRADLHVGARPVLGGSGVFRLLPRRRGEAE